MLTDPDLLGPDLDSQKAFVIALYSSIGEEALFRGFLQPCLIRKIGEATEAPDALLVTVLGVIATSLDVQGLGTRDAFMGGRLAMVEDGSWALKDILAKSDFRIGVAPFPSGPARRVTLATTDGFGIYAGTEHPEEAWELIQQFHRDADAT